MYKYRFRLEIYPRILQEIYLWAQPYRLHMDSPILEYLYIELLLQDILYKENAKEARVQGFL